MGAVHTHTERERERERERESLHLCTVPETTFVVACRATKNCQIGCTEERERERKREREREMVCINNELLLAHLDYAGHRVHHRAIEPFPDPLEEAADAALLQALAGGPLFELVCGFDWAQSDIRTSSGLVTMPVTPLMALRTAMSAPPITPDTALPDSAASASTGLPACATSGVSPRLTSQWLLKRCSSTGTPGVREK